MKKIWLLLGFIILLFGCADLSKNPYDSMTHEEILFSKKLLNLVNTEYNEKEIMKLLGEVQEKIRISKHGTTDFYDPFKPDKGQIRFYVHNNKITRITWVRLGDKDFIWSPERHQKFTKENPK